MSTSPVNHSDPTNGNHPDAVVIGAGIGGLVAARTLRSRGLRVVILESNDRVGGQIRSAELEGLDGVLLDVGAEAFAARGTAVAELVAELGLQVVEPAGLSAWCYAAGRAFPLPKAGMLGIPGDPWASDVRRAIGTLGSLRAGMDRFLPARTTDLSNLDAFVRSRMGSRVAERLVAPVAAGVHSAPLDRLDIDAVTPGLRPAFEREGSLAKAVASMRRNAPAGSAVRGIVGGMHRLIERLVEELTSPGRVAAPGSADDGEQAGPPAEIRLRSEVVALERDDDGWRVTTTDGPLTSPRLVVTTPTVVDLLAPHVGHAADVVPDPEPGADVRLMSLLLRAPELDDAPRGSGMLVAPPHRDAGRDAHPPLVQAKALTHATAKWPWLGERVREALGPGHHVVRLSYGRFGVSVDPDPETVVEDVSRLFGVALRGRVLGSLQTRWNGSMPPPSPAYRREVAGFAERVAATDGLAVTGAWIAGTGMASIVAHAQEAAAQL